MKKAISLLLALVLCLSLCACGGKDESSEIPTTTELVTEPSNSAENPLFDKLVAEKWCALDSNASLTFLEDGTGYTSASYSLTWELNDNRLVYTIHSLADITARLTYLDSHSVFLFETGGALVPESIRESMLSDTSIVNWGVTYLEFIDNNNETIYMSSSDFIELAKTNEAKLKSQFEGATVTLIGKIDSIELNVNDFGHECEGRLTIGDWFVEITESQAASFNIGDVVKVVGTFTDYNTQYSPRLYDWSQYKGMETYTVSVQLFES